MLHRLSGIGLTAYLFLHLAVLDQLRGGEAHWDAFISLVKSPWFLLLDIILLFGFVLHGLNGLRLTLLGFGIGLRWQKWLAWAALIIAAFLTLWGAAGILIFIRR
jgi:succinate dehydrogenase / fumarate reductase cytochrome b subunit